MASDLNVRPLRPNSFRARALFGLWQVGVGIYNCVLISWIVFTLLCNSLTRIGKDPKRKAFRAPVPGRRQKVGIVSEYYYPHLGGLSGDVHFAAVELAKKGYDVKLITSNVAEPHNLHFSPLGFEILRVGRSTPVIANGSLAKIAFSLRIGTLCKKMLEREQFDLIHIHCPLTPILPILIQRYADCPIIGHVHTLLKSKHFFYRVFEKALGTMMRDYEGRIAVSKVCAKPFEEWFNCEFEVIPNGVPVDEFILEGAKKIPIFDDNKTNLFFIGRMEPRNGISVLVDAFRLIHKAEPNTRLILAGAGPLKAFFEDTIEAEFKDDVHFIGPILEEKPAYFATADINICPTTRVASLGVTLLESMASGKPTVCSDIAAFNETAKDGVDVLMADPDSPEAFAAQVLKIIRDPGLGTRLAAAAREKMERAYSWEAIIERVDQYSQQKLREIHGQKMEAFTLPPRVIRS